MRIPRENQPIFFGLAVHQRGATDEGLETIALEVDFREVEARVAVQVRDDFAAPPWLERSAGEGAA